MRDPAVERSPRSNAGEPATQIDIFLSHGSPNNEWVRSLKRELEVLKLRIFLDDEDLNPGQLWVSNAPGKAERRRGIITVRRGDQQPT